VIEVAGRFVGEEDGRVLDRGAGDGHPLLFAAGKLRRPGAQAMAESGLTF
jgi:hypothetical protein